MLISLHSVCGLATLMEPGQPQIGSQTWKLIRTGKRSSIGDVL